MKNFKNTNEKLIAIINEKLNTVNASKEEREKTKLELGFIQSNDDATIFLFYYDLVQFLQKENIYFCKIQRNIYCCKTF